MALPLHLAMTAGEFDTCQLPAFPAYMACHFSAYGKGLQDLPGQLPQGCLLILDDRIPVWDHDPRQVAEQLHRAVSMHSCSGLLLDLQRPGEPLAQIIVDIITSTLPCPVAATEAYARESDCAVLIESPRVNEPLVKRIQPWQGRELWLEIAPQTVRYTVTKGGCRQEEIHEESKKYSQFDEHLCCSYRVEIGEDHAVFTLRRTREDLQKLMAQAEDMGFTRAVGLYQQLQKLIIDN